jgi:acetolactate synthase-1/2/3 large subunit
MAQGSNARTQRGRGRVSVERIPYVVDQALKVLDGLKHVILVGAKMPVAFFAYPNKPSQLTPEGCEGHVLARPEEDQIRALNGCATRSGRAARRRRSQTTRSRRPPPATSPRRRSAPRSARCCRRMRSSPTRR